MPSSSRFILKDSHPAIQQFVEGKSTNRDIASGGSNNNNKSSGRTSRGLFIGRRQSSKDHEDNGGDDEVVAEETSTTATAVQGHTYHTAKGLQPGGITLHDMVAGMKYAGMSITDDKPDTLKNVGKANPWQIQSLRIMLQDCCPEIDGETLENEIHQPLSYLMEKYYQLTIDHQLDICGWKGGHVLDTQGYIGHNENTIVLAYRCTTSAKDWLTNLSTTTSVWESEDMVRGHSGALSGIADHVMKSRHHPWVHTGFYNNFIASVPAIEQYIDPLLADTSKPKTFYIVGHSLGGGIAHMALCYFLLEHRTTKYNWQQLPHRIVLVTAGSPRAYTSTMQERIDDELRQLKGTVSAIRLVRNKDTVPHVPPISLGFHHCHKFVYITKDGAILINPNLKHVIPKKTYQALLQRHPSISNGIANDSNTNNTSTKNDDYDNDSDDDDDEEGAGTEQRQDDADHPGNDNKNQEIDNTAIPSSTSYDKMIQMIPTSLRDHMPEFYLKPLLAMYHKEKQLGSITTGVNQKVDDIVVSYDVNDGEETFDMVWNRRILSNGDRDDEEDVVNQSMNSNKFSPKRIMSKSFPSWLKK